MDVKCFQPINCENKIQGLCNPRNIYNLVWIFNSLKIKEDDHVLNLFGLNLPPFSLPCSLFFLTVLKDKPCLWLHFLLNYSKFVY